MTATKAVCYILFTWANLGIYIFFLVTVFQSALRFSKKRSLLLIALSFLLTAVFEVLFLEADSLFAIYRPVMRFVMVLLNSALALLLIQKQPIQICFSVFMTLTIQSNTIAAGELLMELNFLPTLIDGFPGFNFLLYTLCVLLIFCPLLYLLFCKFLRRAMELGLDLRQWRGLLLLPVLHFIYQMCSGNGGALVQPATWGSLLNLLLFHFCTVITYIAVIQLLLYSHDKYEATNRAELTAQQLTLQEERYELLQTHVTETNRLLHDWRHHMLVFRDFIARDDRDGLSAYLDRLGEVYHVSESPPLCARTAVDVILRHYLGLATDHGITVTTHVEIPDSLNCPDLDLCVVFGNLAENALEACLRQTEGERYIDVTARCIGGQMLAVRVENSCRMDSLSEQDGIFRSSKRNRFGTGLVSTQSVVLKTGGTFHVTAQDGVFIVEALLNS